MKNTPAIIWTATVAMIAGMTLARIGDPIPQTAPGEMFSYKHLWALATIVLFPSIMAYIAGRIDGEDSQ